MTTTGQVQSYFATRWVDGERAGEYRSVELTQYHEDIRNLTAARTGKVAKTLWVRPAAPGVLPSYATVGISRPGDPDVVALAATPSEQERVFWSEYRAELARIEREGR